MGKVLRGQGTHQQWTTASELASARWDALFTIKVAGKHNTATKEQRDFIKTLPEALPKSVLANALTRRAGLQHASENGKDVEERMGWVMKRTWGLGFNGTPSLAGVATLTKTLERWLHNWPSLIHLAKTNPEGARIFTRRQSAYEDAHVGIHVGSSGGMPKNYYSSVSVLPEMRDADLTYLRQLHAKLKPLADLLSQTQGSARAAADHERNIKDMKMYAEKITELKGLRDEMVSVDTEVLKWLDSRPSAIKDGRLNIRTSSDGQRDTTFYQLLGRRSWEGQMKHAKTQHSSYLARVEAYSPDISADMIDHEAVKKAITEVLKDAVKWVCTYTHDFTTDGGEEQ